MTFCANHDYALSPRWVRRKRGLLKYWKHRRGLLLAATSAFPKGTRFEILMTIPRDHGQTTVIFVSRTPGLDREAQWEPIDFPPVDRMEAQRMDIARGVIVMARRGH